MSDLSQKNNLDNFSNIEDEIIIKQGNNFKVFSHGNLSNFDILSSLKKQKRAKIAKTNEILDTGLEELSLSPPAPIIWKKKSSFYFDIQDEEEIAQELKKIEKMKKEEEYIHQKQEIKKYSLNKIINKILENYNLNLLPALEKRLGNIVLSFLKNMRTKIDALDLLQSPINKSGLSLSPDLSKQLMDLLSNIKQKIDEVGGQIIEDQKYININQDQINSKNNFQVKNLNNLSNADPRQKITAQKENVSIPVIKRIQSVHHRPVVVGIKNKEKVVSPLDEFAEISLITFRRLSKNPVEATQKIMDKIAALEKESYLKKATAIKNWRKSEIYKLYLNLGKESMEKNLAISKVIERKLLAKEKVLTEDEFKAITDLNKKLRF